MSDETTRAYDHERSDVAVRWPILLGVGVLLSLPVAVAIVAALLNSIWALPTHPVTGPRVEVRSLGADAPRLQTDPQGDLAALRKQWKRQLRSTGWVDRDAGITHIPIGQAKRMLVENGLQQDTKAPPPSRAERGADRAGNAAARPARNRYRDDEMSP